MKTGLIYCPKHAGLKSSVKRWEKIASALKEEGIEYDFVQSENSQSVERLVTMMIHNGYDTIILCGGDSALNDAANCLMRETKEVRENITLGVIPNGLMNDFASFWGLTEKNLKLCAESIKAKRVRRIDAGYLVYTNKEGKREKRYFLNCVNVGLIAGIQLLKMRVRKIVFSRKLSYVFSLMLLIFQRMFWKMEYTINYEKETHRIMTMCIGSALGYGQTPNAVPYNGMIDVTVVHHSPLTQIFTGIALFLKGKILNAKVVKPYRSHEMKLLLPKNTPVTIDGHQLHGISTGADELVVKVEQEAINFIIEK